MESIDITYFGPVSWYMALKRGAGIDMKACYVKQTTRNHCRIATANGVQKLTVPVSLPTKMNCPIRDVRISDHGNWRHQHWEALSSAYGMSPFFEYYADDIIPFFQRKWDFLLDFDMEITHTMCRLINANSPGFIDINCCHEGHNDTNKPLSVATTMQLTPYYQTFQLRHGFIPDLSILDLLFNEGPDSVRILGLE